MQQTKCCVGHKSFLSDNIRVDLVRNKNTDKDSSQMETSTSDIRVKSDYTWVVVDLGNGLVMDARHNLSVDLTRLYKIQGTFLIQSFNNDVLKTRGEYERKKTDFRRSSADPAIPDVYAQYSTDGLIDLTGEVSSYHQTIDVQKDSVEIDSKNFLSFGGKTKFKQVDENKVEFPGLVTSEIYTLRENSRIELNSFTLKKLDSNEIEIQQNSLIDSFSPKMYFVKTADGCAFSDVNNNYYVIKKEGQTITVTKNNELKTTYKVMEQKE